MLENFPILVGSSGAVRQPQYEESRGEGPRPLGCRKQSSFAGHAGERQTDNPMIS